MKRFTAIGMPTFALPAIILLSMALPAVAFAGACPESEYARELLAKEPIGNYTKEVLERADIGIAKAKTQPANWELLSALGLTFLIRIQSTMFMLVNTDLQMAEYSRDLEMNSPCLHADQAMIEAKIEEVRCELNNAYDAKSSDAIYTLDQVADFLNQRYKHLVKGALDPSYVDTSWAYNHGFDQPFEGWCCVADANECQISTGLDCTGEGGFYPTADACLNGSTCFTAQDGEIKPHYGEICPFDSNYLPYNDSGYGCNADLLTKFAGIEGSENALLAERSAQAELSATRDAFLKDISHINETTISMDVIADGAMLSDEERTLLLNFGKTASGSLEHRRVYNCGADLPPEVRKNLDNVEGTLTPNAKPSEEWGAVSARGPFSFQKDHIGIWKEFLRLQQRQVDLREFPDYMKHPDEFVAASDRKDATIRYKQSLGLLQMFADYFRSRFRQFSLGQATQEAGILPKAHDMGASVRDTLAPVRAAMKKNIDLVTDSSTGLRQFARNYAYFLRRSCIERPCNEKLETILKTLYSDECFPYASGDFTGNLERNPEYDACLKEHDQSFCDSTYDAYLNDPSWQKCQDAVFKK